MFPNIVSIFFLHVMCVNIHKYNYTYDHMCTWYSFLLDTELTPEP